MSTTEDLTEVDEYGEPVDLPRAIARQTAQEVYRRVFALRHDPAVASMTTEVAESVIENLRAEGLLPDPDSPPEDAVTSAPQAPAEITTEVLTYHDLDGERLPEGQAMIVAYDGQTDVGALRWDYLADPPVVVDVTVDPIRRRQGIASRLWREAVANESRLTHSASLTDDGRAWVESLDAR